MPGEGIGSPGAGITGGWELPDVGVGNQMQIFFFFFFFFETKHLFLSVRPLVPTLKTEFLVQRVREPFSSRAEPCTVAVERSIEEHKDQVVLAADPGSLTQGLEGGRVQMASLSCFQTYFFLSVFF